MIPTKTFQLASFSLVFAIGITGCTQTTHAVATAEPAPSPVPQEKAWQTFVQQLEAPGPVSFKRHVAANWKIDRSGLLNLEHPRAQAAGLTDELEPIEVVFYILEHPEHGGFMIDSGIARSVALQSDDMPVRWPVSAAMPMDTLDVRLDTQQYLASRSAPLQGVFLTHLHLDHILGLQDVPKTTPLFIGAQEAEDTRVLHSLARPTTDLNLRGFSALQEWTLQTDARAPFPFVDVFGDQSVVGLHVPGHTRGNMAFVVRTPNGAQLLTGDACHTTWGWQHEVEPGTFNTDGEKAADSLRRLKAFAAAHPAMTVHVGHQDLGQSERFASRNNAVSPVAR